MAGQNTLFHATQKWGIKHFRPGEGNLGPGTYFCKTPEAAMTSGSMQWDGDVTAVRLYEIKLTEDAKLFRSNDVILTPDEIDAITQEGYAGIETRMEVVIFEAQKHTQIIKERDPKITTSMRVSMPA